MTRKSEDAARQYLVRWFKGIRLLPGEAKGPRVRKPVIRSRRPGSAQETLDFLSGYSKDQPPSGDVSRGE